jgi:LysM repeat protein
MDTVTESKMAIAMASNVALAMIMTTGCQTLMNNRTAMDSEAQDPYESAPVVNIENPENSTPDQITPTKLNDSVASAEDAATVKVEEAKAEATAKVEEAKAETTAKVEEAKKEEPSYKKYVVPADYKNPTEGLKPTKSLPDRTEPKEEAPVTDEKVVDENGYFTYVVKNGDCLSVIANSNGVKTKELAEINNLKPDAHVFIGQKLKVPAGREPFTNKKEPCKKTENNVDDSSIYIVKSGDCLSIIAQKLGVKTADLVAANNLKSADSIYVDQKLKVPANAKAPASNKTNEATPVEKKVETQKNTSEVAPAKKEETKTPTPTKAENDPFSLDQTSDPFAPATEESQATPAAPAEKPAEPIEIPPAPVEAEEEANEADPFDIDSVINNFNATAEQKVEETVAKFENLKVTEGDTLELIAANYSTTAEALRKLNGFDSTKKLKAGEIIKIPAQTTK